MKVKDLIKQLQEFDGDMEVLLTSFDSDAQEWDYWDLGVDERENIRIVTNSYNSFVPSDPTMGKVQNVVSIRRY